MTETLQAPLSEAERARLGELLLDFMARHTARYTAGGSSSLPVDTAQALLTSLRFTLGLDDPARQRALLETGFEQGYREGVAALQQRVARGKRLWAAVCAHPPEVTNRAMANTLKALGGFWRRYDVLFFAAELPCSIDYPLADPVPETALGIDYVNLYLTRLALENDFLRRFSHDAVWGVLCACCPGPERQLINLFEPVAANALGRALLGGESGALSVTAAERGRLEGLLAAPGALTSAAQTLSRRLSLSPAQAVYLGQYASALTPRAALACSSGGLDGIFLTAK